ncbi:hypothetical protein CONPUDRAFT_62761, partial [Coniophora puteana RWD-64-598 SS2]
MGSPEDHTVYEAELVGILLGATLLHAELTRRSGTASLGVDNQAAIRALTNRDTHPGQYLVDAAVSAITAVPTIDHPICIRWTPGHVGIQGNETADEHAKRAAQGSSSAARHLPRFLRDG